MDTRTRTCTHTYWPQCYLSKPSKSAFSPGHTLGTVPKPGGSHPPHPLTSALWSAHPPQPEGWGETFHFPFLSEDALSCLSGPLMGWRKAMSLT